MAIKVTVVDGNITDVEAQALITAATFGGDVLDNVDNAITDVAGDQYLRLLAKGLQDYPDVEAVVCKPLTQHDGMFDHVVYVIDNLDKSMGQLVECGLATASAAGYRSVTMAAMRFGVTRNVVADDARQLEQMILSIVCYQYYPYNVIEELTIVVNGDRVLCEMLRQRFARIDLS